MDQPIDLRIWSPLLLAVALSGCAEETAIEKDAIVSSWPEVITDGGVQWRRTEEFTVADRDRLSEYAAQNPSVFDNPLVRGDPTVYANDAGSDRLYWTQPAINGTEWLYIQFGPGGASSGEGVGPPFPVQTP